MNPDVEQRHQQLQGMLDVVCSRFRLETEKLGIALTADEKLAEQAEFHLSRDPASGKDTLVGTWKNATGQKIGEVLFHADGSFFAEYDVIKNHPTDNRWFIEAVTVWGRGSNIKSELRLLPSM